MRPETTADLVEHPRATSSAAADKSETPSLEGCLPVDEREYCCVGCRIAAAVTRERGETGAARWMLVRLGLSLFLTLNVLAFSMALWTRDVYASESDSQLAGPLEDLLRYLCLIFSLPVLFLLGIPLAESAWQGLRRRVLSTDLLLVTGVAAAYFYSAVSVFRDSGPIYFEVGCVILVMVTLGRWLEATGKLQAGAALEELEKMLPEQIRVCDLETERIVPLREARVGDRLRVLPGERFPTDGRLLSESLHADEQIISGESRPVVKQRGDSLSGGTLNLDADCLLEVTARPDAGTLSRMIAMVRQARENRGHYQQLADRLSAWIFPIMSLVAFSAGGWHAWHEGFDRGLLVGLSVVLVTCPCALGLATPLAIWAALGLAARKQVLFRSGEAFERLATIRAIRFDKTGTLTTGLPSVTNLVVDPDTAPAKVVAQGAALARSSSHPYSAAIVRFAGSHDAVPAEPDELPISIRQIPGRGMFGARDEDSPHASYLGNRAWMDETGLSWPPVLSRAAEEATNAGNPLSFVGWDGWVRGLFVFSEELRAGAIDALARCQQLGLDVAILTGDHRARGNELAKRFAVPVLAELSPAAKVAEIRHVHAAVGPVAMVGDGINDAPALAASDVGVALGCGADVSRDSALVCLLSDDPSRLTWAVEFSRRGVRAIRRNLLWAFAYNGFGVALAAAGWLNPAAAALLMVVSSLLVVGHALSLGRDTVATPEEREVPIADRHSKADNIEAPAKVAVVAGVSP